MKVFIFRENAVDAIESLDFKEMSILFGELKAKGDFTYMKNVDNILHVYIGIDQVRKGLERHKVEDSQAFLGQSAAMF